MVLYNILGNRRKYYSLKTILYEKMKIAVESSSEESDNSDHETKGSNGDDDSNNSNYCEE